MAESLYAGLIEAGAEVLFDDRDLRPGPKFKDADLVGVPLRLTVGERNLKDGKVEVHYREDGRTELVAPEDVVGTVVDFYGDVF